jgi:hypothetical protein
MTVLVRRFRCARPSVHFHRFHERKIDHQPIVARRHPSDAVSARPNRQPCSHAKRTAALIIRTKRYDIRPTINPSIPDSSSFVIASVRRGHQLATELLAKERNCAAAHCIAAVLLGARFQRFADVTKPHPTSSSAAEAFSFDLFVSSVKHRLFLACRVTAGLTRPLRDRFCQVHFAFH